MFRHISIIGVGLVGGSLGLALKRAGFAGRIVGCDRKEVLEGARKLGAIDEGLPDLSQALAGADLVILAAPVCVIVDLLYKMKDAVSPSALVTDVGSTKGVICNRAREALPDGPLFLGGHPLAGSEQSGFEHADAALFDGTHYLLTPHSPDDLSDARVKAFSELIHKIGAMPFVTDSRTHDRAMALLSHLPQLLSTGLAGLVAERSEGDFLPLEMAAAGFRDMTRLAESPYSVWRDICLTNTENLRDVLDLMIHKLESLKHNLSARELERDFGVAQGLRNKLNRSQPAGDN